MPAMPIDSLVAAPAATANAANPAEPGSAGENAPSFQATLAKELRHQGSDAKAEPATARKPERGKSEEINQSADPAQADLLLPGLIKPHFVPPSEADKQAENLPGLAQGPASSAGADKNANAGSGAADVIDTTQAQILMASQIQPRDPVTASHEIEPNDAASPAVENGARSKKTLILNRDADSVDDPATARKGAFRQGLDRTLEQAAANKSEHTAAAIPVLNRLAATDVAAPQPAARSGNEIGNEVATVARAAGQANEEKRATGVETAAAPKSPDSLKPDPISSLSAELRTAFNIQAVAAQQSPNALPGLRLEARMGTEAWSSALGQQVILMVAGQQQQAEIHLNPESLGPIKVTVTLDNNQASLSFVAREASVRDAIESSLPKLTSMMLDSGISLGQTNVAADNSGSPTPWTLPQPSGQGRANSEASETVAAVPGTGARTRVQQGLIDTFA